ISEAPRWSIVYPPNCGTPRYGQHQKSAEHQYRLRALLPSVSVSREVSSAQYWARTLGRETRPHPVDLRPSEFARPAIERCAAKRSFAVYGDRAQAVRVEGMHRKAELTHPDEIPFHSGDEAREDQHETIFRPCNSGAMSRHLSKEYSVCPNSKRFGRDLARRFECQHRPGWHPGRRIWTAWERHRNF